MNKTSSHLPVGTESPEEIARLKALSRVVIEKKARDQRKSKLSAVAMTVVVHAVAILILMLWILPGLKVDPPQIMARTLPPSENPVQTVEQTQSTVRSKPSAPSSSTRVITSHSTVSAAFVPPSEVQTTTGDIGTGTSIGMGFGSSGFGSGMGGNVSFFGQSTRAQRVLFIIDVSQSMRVSGSLALMKEELAKTLKLLKPGIEYGIILFSGPVWQIGDEISDNKKEVTNARVIKSEGAPKVTWATSGNQFTWDIKSGKLPSLRWHKVTSSQIDSTLREIKEITSIAGTDLRHPFKMAFDANPKPDTIYFMTDAQPHAEANERVRDIVKENARGLKKIPINCIVMMESQALAHMKTLAKGSDGMLSFVEKGGKLKHIIK